jgi:hypothetical protein
MRTVPENCPPLVRDQPYEHVDSIAKYLNRAWRDAGSSNAKLFLLCVSLPKAVGCKPAAIFIDNLLFCVRRHSQPTRGTRSSSRT